MVIKLMLLGRLQQRLREGWLILTGAISLFLLLALLTYHASDSSWSNQADPTHIVNAGGEVGAWLSDVFLCLFGYVAFVFPFMLLYAVWIAGRQIEELLLLRASGFLLILLSATGLLDLHWHWHWMQLPEQAGGIVGGLIGHFLKQVFNAVGATLLLLALLLMGVTLFTGWSWFLFMENVGKIILQGVQIIRKTQAKYLKNIFSADHKKTFPLPAKPEVLKKIKNTVKKEPKFVVPEAKVETDTEEEAITAELNKAARRTKTDVIPKLSLLDTRPIEKNKIVNPQELQERSQIVEACLADFGVAVKVVAVHPGPVVTRYELELAAGTKVSKITNLAKDLARSLSVISVRVVEVIPGKSVIGLELPNDYRETVGLKDVVDSKAYKNARSPLTLALGKDIAGQPVIADLAKMPHLLVAGTTGAGKSVCLNAMLLSLLYKSTPQQLRLILIDPKMLELSIYDGIPHLLAPVVTDMKDAASALRWCVIEMERRYRTMASLGVRNILGYNAKILQAKEQGAPILDPLFVKNDQQTTPELTELPYVVVIADEFADMMVVVGKKVETLIARLAQKARAAGIHIILATQRPSVDVITGLIKANIPSRIAFQVSSKIDSRTILDQQGAEQLLGQGDMLYLPPGFGVPVRVHGAYVSDEEVHRVVQYLRQSGGPKYLDEILDETAGRDLTGYTEALVDETDAEKDEFYDAAVALVIKMQRASISSIQRHFKIGYNRSARIVEAMEMAGVVGPMESNGAREVLVPSTQE